MPCCGSLVILDFLICLDCGTLPINDFNGDLRVGEHNLNNMSTPQKPVSSEDVIGQKVHHYCVFIFVLLCFPDYPFSMTGVVSLCSTC